MRVWKRCRDMMTRSLDLLGVSRDVEQKKMEPAPYRKRYTLESLDSVAEVSTSTLRRMRKRNDIKITTSAIKPLLIPVISQSIAFVVHSSIR